MSRIPNNQDKNSTEQFNKEDVKAGLKLIGEIMGSVILSGLTFYVITVSIPQIKIVYSSLIFAIGIITAIIKIRSMNETHRKQVKAVFQYTKKRFCWHC